MKKIVISLCFTFILSAFSTITYAQMDGMGINAYVDSAPSTCPTTGVVDGSISAYSGTWWGANEANYTGPGFYYLYVPNASTYCGTVHAWATTDTQDNGNNTTKYCHGGTSEGFSFPGHPYGAQHFDLELIILGLPTPE